MSQWRVSERTAWVAEDACTALRAGGCGLCSRLSESQPHDIPSTPPPCDPRHNLDQEEVDDEVRLLSERVCGTWRRTRRIIPSIWDWTAPRLGQGPLARFCVGLPVAPASPPRELQHTLHRWRRQQKVPPTKSTSDFRNGKTNTCDNIVLQRCTRIHDL